MDHVIRLGIGLALIVMVLGTFLMFTVAFGPFNLFEALGAVAFLAFAYWLGREVEG